jgi:hypothetical protein
LPVWSARACPRFHRARLASPDFARCARPGKPGLNKAAASRRTPYQSFCPSLSPVVVPLENKNTRTKVGADAISKLGMSDTSVTSA